MEIQMGGGVFELGNPEGRGAQAVLEIQVDGASKNRAFVVGVWIFSEITHYNNNIRRQHGEQGMAQWWECSPPTNLARVQMPLCGLNLLLVLSFAPRGFFSGHSSFPLLLSTNISKFQFEQESHTGRWRTSLWMCYLQTIIIIYYYYLLSSQSTCPATQRPEFRSCSVYQQLDLFLSSLESNITTTVVVYMYILGTLRCLLWLTSNTGFSIIYLKFLSRWQRCRFLGGPAG